MRRLFSMTYSSVSRGAFHLAVICLLASSLFGRETIADETSDKREVPARPGKAARVVDFQKDLLPALRRNCLACHSKSRAKGRLILESPKSILVGGESGAVALPGKGIESLLYLAAAYREEPEMPPEGNKAGAKRLSDEELELLKLWIDQGAKGSLTRQDNAREWHPLPEGLQPVQAVALSSEGRFAACGRAGQIFVYDVAAGAKQDALRLTDPTLLERGVYDKPGVAHLDSVHALRFHPDNDLLISGGFRTVKLWRHAAVLTASKAVTAEAKPRLAAWSADGKFFASLRDERVVLQKADGTEQLGAAWPGGRAAVAIVALPDRILVATDNSIEVLKALEEGDPIWTSRALEPAATCLAAANSELILAGSADGKIRLYSWKGETYEEQRQLEHGAAIEAIALSSDSKRVASLGGGHLKIFDAHDGKQIVDVSGDAISLSRVARTAARKKLFERRVAAAKKVVDDAVKAVKKAQEEEKKAAEAELAAATDLVSRKDTAAKASTNTDAKVKKKAEQELAKSRNAHEAALRKKNDTQADRGRAERKVETRRSEHAVEVENLQSVESSLVAASAEQPLTGARTIGFTPDGRVLVQTGDRLFVWRADGQPLDSIHCADPLIALGGVDGLSAIAADGRIVEIDLKGDWRLERTIGDVDNSGIFSDRVMALDVSADGKLLAVGGGEPSRQGEVKIWSLDESRFVFEAGDVHNDSLYSVSFSACGRYLATAGADRFARVFRISDRKVIAALEGHSGHVMGVSWKSDGLTLATCGADNVVKVWNVESREVRRTISGFGKQVTSIRFVGETQNIVTACGDRTVRMHDANGGKQVRSFGGFGDFVYDVSVTPDGKRVAAGGHDSTLRIWDGANGKQLVVFEAPK